LQLIGASPQPQEIGRRLQMIGFDLYGLVYAIADSGSRYDNCSFRVKKVGFERLAVNRSEN
jgi:hypothetical protein